MPSLKIQNIEPREMMQIKNKHTYCAWYMVVLTYMPQKNLILFVELNKMTFNLEILILLDTLYLYQEFQKF